MRRALYWARRMAGPITHVGGLGRCGRCGMSWAWAEPHLTNLGSGRGCFSLCRMCWADLPGHVERMPYYARDRARYWPALDPAELELAVLMDR
jgi:hypothetical protein